jgi:hypothetical protein
LTIFGPFLSQKNRQNTLFEIGSRCSASESVEQYFSASSIYLCLGSKKCVSIKLQELVKLVLSLSGLGHEIPSKALLNISYSQRFIGCLFNLTKGSPVWRRGIEWSGKCKSPHANGEMP